MDTFSERLDAIVSDRLVMIPMPVEFYEASLAGDAERASRIIGLEVHPEWLLKRRLMEIRLGQLRQDAGLLPWLLRAIGLRATGRRPAGQMIGHIGFHTRPGAAYLADIAPGGVELGYSIYPEYRRKGYATEACLALMDWAQREHNISLFVVSISPKNTPSLRIAERFGFKKAGSQVDEMDGPEDIFVREAQPET